MSQKSVENLGSFLLKATPTACQYLTSIDIGNLNLPRRARFCPKSFPVHVIQRGNNRHTILTSDTDMAAYMHWLNEGAVKFDVLIHGWVLMTNHVHLIMTPQTNDALSRLFQYTGRIYVRYFNYSYARSGTLYEGQFKSSIIEDDHYLLIPAGHIVNTFPS